MSNDIRTKVRLFLLAFFGFVTICFVLSNPSFAFANTVLVNDARHPDGTSGVSVPETNVYITRLSADNATYGGLSNVHYGNSDETSENGFMLNTGATNGSFWVKYENAGYDVYGQSIDIELDIMAQSRTSDSDQNDVFYTLSGLTSGTGSGINLTFDIKVFKAGTTQRYSNASFFVLFTDIDVVVDDDSWSEGVYFEGNNWLGTEWLGNVVTSLDVHPGAEGGVGKLLNHNSSQHRYWASHSCEEGLDAMVSTIGYDGARVVWTGNYSGMGGRLGITSVTQKYPGNPTFGKTRTSDAVTASNGTTTWSMDMWLPDVVSSNQASSITITDQLPASLDASGAVVTIKQGGSDVTSAWTITKNGAENVNTVTIKAKSTQHGSATGSYTITMSAPVRRSNNFSNDGATFTSASDLHVTNSAALVVVPQSGSAITIGPKTAVVDISGAVSPNTLLQKADPDRGNGKPQGQTTMAGAEYTIEYWRGWSVSGSAASVTKWVTDSNGLLQFKSGSSSSGTWFKKSGSNNLMPWGTYRITETKAPDGYSKDSVAHIVYVRSTDASGTPYFEVDGSTPWAANNSSATTGWVSKEPAIIRGGVIIAKRDSQSNNGVAQGDATLKDAVFEVVNNGPNPVVVNGREYASGAVCLELVTDASGNARSSNKTFPYGSYTVREKSESEGYLLTSVSSWSKTFEIRNDGTFVDLTSTPCPENVIRGSVKMQKNDYDLYHEQYNDDTGQGGATLAGAVYSVRNDSVAPVVVNGRTVAVGGECIELVCDSDGYAESAGNVLPYGTYTVTEKTAPPGYHVNTSYSSTFVIRQNGMIVDISADAALEQVKRGNVVGMKHDIEHMSAAQGDATLAGAEYIIYSHNDNPVVITEDNNHEIFLDADTVARVVTDAHGMWSVEGLPYGSYYVQETKPSEGYLLSDVVRLVTITEEGQTIRLAGSSSGLPEKVMRGGLTLAKTDWDIISKQGDATFAGAEFSIINRSAASVVVNGNTIEPGGVCITTTTDGEGIARLERDVLPYGTYEVVETKAPEGYHLNESWSVRFSISRDKEIVDITSNPCRDKVIRGGVRIAKVDAATGRAEAQGDATLAGARFAVLYSGSGSVYVSGREYVQGDIVARMTTDANGIATIADGVLPYGTYTIVEEVPSYGYSLTSESVRFQIRDTGIVDVTDEPFHEPVRGSVIMVGKVDEDEAVAVAAGNASLAGAVFEVRNISGHPVVYQGREYAVGASLFEVTTNEAGVAVLQPSSMPVGTYELVETSAPQGYGLAYRTTKFAVFVKPDGELGFRLL